MIHCEIFGNRSRSRITAASLSDTSLPSRPLSTSITWFATLWQRRPSLKFSSHSASKSDSPSGSVAASSFSKASTFSRSTRRRCDTDTDIPRPYSALSSNSELAHAGPWPRALCVYGLNEAVPPQIDEQPVAFAMFMRSPNSCVISFT